MKIWMSILFIINFSTKAFATPVYYSFTGSVNNITVTEQGGSPDPYQQDIVEFSESNNLGLNSSVSYIVMVDRDRPGTVFSPEYNSLHTFPLHHESSGLTYDYYYSELVAGETLGGWPQEYNYVNSIIRYDSLTFDPDPSYPFTEFKLGSYLSIHNAHTTNNLIDELFVGEEFLFTNAYNGTPSLTTNHFGFVHGSLTLTDISTTYSVSEPPIYVLMLTSLVVLITTIRKMKL